jgi:hypothetical protein
VSAVLGPGEHADALAAEQREHGTDQVEAARDHHLGAWSVRPRQPTGESERARDARLEPGASREAPRAARERPG